MRKIKPGIWLLPAFAGIISCNGSDVTRPPDVNDFDAIYHIISIDRTSEFNLDLIDFTLPDTLPPQLAQVDIEFYWFDLARDSLDLPIDIDYPGSQDSLGSVPEAIAREIKFFYGTLEVIGTDTTGGGNTPFRLSRNFAIRGEISAEFKKYGGDNNFRRGWLLTRISDASFAASYPGGITQITINSDSHPQLIIAPGLKNLGDVPDFAPGESLTVIINGSNLDDKFRIRFPAANGFQTVKIVPENNNLVTGFRMPQAAQYNHFLVEATGEISFAQNGIFRYESVGVLFKVE